jgi:hypothetical protein
MPYDGKPIPPITTPSDPPGAVAVYLDVPTARAILTAFVNEASRRRPEGRLDRESIHSLVTAIALALSNPLNTPADPI